MRKNLHLVTISLVRTIPHTMIIRSHFLDRYLARTLTDWKLNNHFSVGIHCRSVYHKHFYAKMLGVFMGNANPKYL